MLRKIFPLIFIFAFVSLLYYPALFTYFSQDDFFHFKVSQTNGSVLGFLNLLGFHSFVQRGIAFYRPISRELPFNIYYFIFGLNQLPFRIFLFLIHFINIYLVYIFVQKLFNNKSLSLFVSLFFGITAANVATLYYLAGGIQTLLATTFTLSSLLFFQQYLKTNHSKLKVFSFLTFLLGISSHEQAIITPFLIMGLIFINKPHTDFKKYILELIPYFIATLILAYFEISRIGFSSGEQQYQAIFNIKTAINSLFWYTNWALGVPETLIDFVLPGFKLNPTLLRYWSNYYIFIFPSYFLSIILLGVATIYLILKKRLLFKNKVFLFYLVWFPLGLLPVILLPLHKSTHYLVISLPAFWTILGYIILNFYQELKRKSAFFSRIWLTTILSSLIILSIVSAILGSNNYWAASRGKLAQKLINQLKNIYPNLPKNSIIYFKNDPSYPFLIKEWGGSSKQASIVLNGSDALQLLYKDLTLKVFYEDLGGVPKEFLGKDIHSITAKIF